MGDGVKFLIDLESKGVGADQAIKALKHNEDAADALDHKMKEGGESAKGLWHEIVKGDAVWEGIKKGSELAVEGVEKVLDLIKETINVGAGERREKMAMTNLLGGPEEAEEALRYLDRFSELSEFGEEQTKAMGIELLNAGVKGETWKHTLAAIGDAASMSSNKIAGADAALSSFMRMQETGKLDARILRGLHLNMKDVMSGLGDDLGMSPKAVKKALEEGTVPAAKAFETVLRAIEKKTGHELGKNVLSAGEQLGAKLQKLKELPDQIMKGAAASKGMDDLQSGIERVLDAFNPESATGKAMIAGVSDLMGAIGKSFKEIDWESVGTGVRMVVEDFSKMVSHLKDVAGFLADIAGYGDNAESKELKWQSEMAAKHHVVFKGGPETDEHKRLREAGERGTKQAQDEWLKDHPGEELPTSPNYVPRPEAWRVDLNESVPVNNSPVDLRRPSLPDIGSLSAANATTNVSAKVEVVQNFNGSPATPKDAEAIGKSTGHGLGAGLTNEIEQQGLHAGVRSARKRKHQWPASIKS